MMKGIRIKMVLMDAHSFIASSLAMGSLKIAVGRKTLLVDDE